MAIGDILSNLPEVLQNQIAINTFTYTFDSDTDEYTFTKAPIMSVLEVSDGSTTYTEGTDFELIENANSPFVVAGTETRVYDAINWGIGGDSPSDGDTFTVKQRYETLLSRYLKAHDEQIGVENNDGELVSGLEHDIVSVVESRQIDNATGDDLDRIGAIFGQLGKRKTRNDTDYRAYLKSIVDSFSGRGSRSGLKFAIAAAVGTTTDNIEIQENIEELSYTIIISNVNTQFISSSIDELAELADPSGVELEEAIISVEGNEILIEGGSSSISAQSVGLGGGTLDLDGTEGLGGFAITSNGDSVPQ